MRTLKAMALTTGLLLGSASTVHAGCGIEGGSIRILANDFAALHAVVGTAEQCAGDGVTFSKNHTTEHRDLQVAALTANPAAYTSAIVANSSIVPLLNEGPDPAARRPRCRARPVTEEEPAHHHRRQGHGRRVHGERATSLLSQGPPRESRGESADVVRGSARRGKGDQGHGPRRASLRDEHQGRLEPGRGVREHVPRFRRRVLQAGHGAKRASTTKRASRP